MEIACLGDAWQLKNISVAGDFLVHLKTPSKPNPEMAAGAERPFLPPGLGKSRRTL
jgi:hypothetical protein